MKRYAFTVVLILLLMLAVVALASTLTLDTEPGTQAAGGGIISGGSYSARTTIGQPVAVESMQGGDYTVNNRYWSSPERVVYMPMLRK